MSKHPLYNSTGLQRNNKSHVLYALADKKMELKHLEDEYQTKLLKLQSDISALETTICLFDSNCRETISKIDKKVSKNTNRSRSQFVRNSYFEKGECKKLVLDVLRRSKETLSTEDISLKLQDIKDISKDDTVLNKKIQKTVVAMLRKLEKVNLVNQVGKRGLEILWDIKELSH